MISSGHTAAGRADSSTLVTTLYVPGTLHINSFNFHSNSIFPLKEGNLRFGEVKRHPKVTELITGGAGVHTQPAWLQSCCF